jgi:hypothetical protein
LALRVLSGLARLFAAAVEGQIDGAEDVACEVTLLSLPLPLLKVAFSVGVVAATADGRGVAICRRW